LSQKRFKKKCYPHSHTSFLRKLQFQQCFSDAGTNTKEISIFQSPCNCAIQELLPLSFFVVTFFEAESHYVAQASAELAILCLSPLNAGIIGSPT
jgi:hypothetical protein